jgi:hypothetical protein
MDVGSFYSNKNTILPNKVGFNPEPGSEKYFIPGTVLSRGV